MADDQPIRRVKFQKNPNGCVLKIKEIHARVTEFCSEKRNADIQMQDGRPAGGRTSEATPIPPAPTSSAGDKKLAKKSEQ